jgi:hypothetical protein
MTGQDETAQNMIKERRGEKGNTGQNRVEKRRANRDEKGNKKEIK